MSRNIDTTRWLVELQGFADVPDDHLRAIDYGLRTGPVFCAILSAVGLVLESPVLLLALSGVALYGAVRGSNPFDVFYNRGLRHLLKGPLLSEYPAPRRFACGVAAVWLYGTAGLMILGAMTAAQVMGWLMAATAAVPVFTGFCVPSFTYRVITKTMPARSKAATTVAG